MPDVTFVYSAGTQAIRAWVEWDEGSMSPKHLAAKLYAYKHAVCARQWRKDHPVLSILHFPVPTVVQE